MLKLWPCSFFFYKNYLVIVSSQKTQFQRKRLPTATITSASEPPTVDTAPVMMPTN